MKKLTCLLILLISTFATNTLQAQALPENKSPWYMGVSKQPNPLLPAKRVQAAPTKKWTDFPELYKKTLLIHAVEIGDVKTIEALCNDFDLDVSKLDRKKYSEQLIKDDLDIKKRIHSTSEKLNFNFLADNVEEEYREKYRLSEYIIREAIQDKDIIISATVIAVFKNDYRSLDTILSSLKKLKSQVAISEFLNKTHVNQNYTLLIMALLSYNPENAEDNVKTINLLLQHGANPKESSLIIDNKKVDVIQIATKTQNIGALKYFKAMYLGLSQSQNFIAPILLEQRAGDKAEIINYVYQARELGNDISLPEIIEVLDDWIEIIEAKSSNTEHLLNKTSTHKIYDDSKILVATININYSIEKETGRICNISVQEPVVNTETTANIKISVDINHFYSIRKRETYNSKSITEAFVSISWTGKTLNRTKLELSSGWSSYDAPDYVDKKVEDKIFGSSGVVKIDSKDPLNPKTTVVSSSKGRLE